MRLTCRLSCSALSSDHSIVAASRDPGAYPHGLQGMLVQRFLGVPDRDILQPLCQSSATVRPTIAATIQRWDRVEGP